MKLRQVSGATVWGTPDTAYEVLVDGKRLGVVSRNKRDWWAWRADVPHRSERAKTRAEAVEKVLK